jgi:prephenate dehydratase
MTLLKKIQGITTLGPRGTDSENAATKIKSLRDISGEIILCESFRNAIKMAINNNNYCLIPAAFSDKDNNGMIIDNWTAINFIEEEIELVDAIILPLKEMCIAKRNNIETINSIILHTATEPFANKYFPGIKKIYCQSKPLAVKLCNDGIADACIGSRDVIEYTTQLQIIKSIRKNMVWTLYQPKN